MLESTGMTKKVVLILLLVILAAGTLIVLYVAGRLVVKPPDYLPPTIDPLVPTMQLSVTVTEDMHAIVLGNTNLPEGTLLNISIIEENGNFSEQNQVTVVNESFQSVQFGTDGGLDVGSYAVEVLMLTANEQPESVRERMGPEGVNLVGDLIIHGAGGGVLKTGARFVVSRPPPVLTAMGGSGIGLTAADYANGFEITLLSAHKAKSAFGEEPPEIQGKEYGNVFIFLEITYKNISEKQLFLSYVDFVIFINEDFALGDINVPYIKYPDARFTVNSEAKEYGFFGLQEVQPGESYTGMIAFMVPDISHRFVFSSNSTSCLEQGGMLQCYSEHPNFEFND
jgi:hypothetical protein